MDNGKSKIMLKRVLGVFLIVICSIVYLPICSGDTVQNGFTAYAADTPTIECGKTYTINMDYDTQIKNGYTDYSNEEDGEEGTFLRSYISYKFFPKEDVVYKVKANYVSGDGVCSLEMYTDGEYNNDLVYTHISKNQPSDSKEGKFLTGYDYSFVFVMKHPDPMDIGYDEDRDWGKDEGSLQDDDYLSGKKLTIKFRIDPVKTANPIFIKGKTVVLKSVKLKKKKQTISLKKAFDILDKQSKVTFKKVNGNKKITISSKGKITVKKGLKKGTYKVKVKCTAAANIYYKKKVKTTTVTIKVK